ncbi:MAG: glycosyltransferase [Planctomycetota bacterium]
MAGTRDSVKKLRQELDEKELQLKKLRGSRSRRKRVHDALQAHIDSLTAERDRLQASLSCLLGSREWRLLQVLRRLRERLAPYGTRRARCVWHLADMLLKRPRHLRGQPGSMPAIIGGPDQTATAMLEKILAAHPERRGIVIYPPLIDWGWMKQRPHQLMLQFARAGFLVFFCPPQTRTDFVGYFSRVAERVYLCGCIDWLYELHSPIVLVNKPQHDEVLRHFHQAYVIYDCLDDLAIHSPTGQVDDNSRGRHRKLLETATVVCATADRLYAEVRQERPDALLVPNAADFDHFHLPFDPVVPPDLAPVVRQGKPLIGYYGALAEWFDFELVWSVARQCPEYNFVLIGPDYDGALREHMVRCPENVHILSEKRYEILPAYLHHFSVATIPFRINEITRATSPIKLFEYMAAGKPIVTTMIPECCKHKLILTATGTDEFVAQLAEALRRGANEEYRHKLLEEARRNSWQARFALIHERLVACGAARPTVSSSEPT